MIVESAPKFTKLVKIISLIFLFITVCLTISLSLISMSAIGASQVGLKYFSSTKTIDESKLYAPGRYFLGFTQSFITFETQQQSVYYDGINYPTLAATSQDGLSLNATIGFQYRILADLKSILNLFYTWGQDYEKAYMDIASDVLRNTIANFTAKSLTTNKLVVENQMLTNLGYSMENISIIQSVQLLDVEFSDDYATSLLLDQSLDLMVLEATNNLTVIQSQMNNILSIANQNVTRITNNYQIEIIETNASALADAQNVILRLNNSIPTLTSLFRQAFGGNDYNSLITYIWSQSIKKIDDSKVSTVLNMEMPKMLACLNNPLAPC